MLNETQAGGCLDFITDTRNVSEIALIDIVSLIFIVGLYIPHKLMPHGLSHALL